MRLTEKDELWAVEVTVALPAAVGLVGTAFNNIILPAAVKVFGVSVRTLSAATQFSITTVLGRRAGADVDPIVIGSVLDGVTIFVYNFAATAANLSLLVWFIVSR